MRRNRSPKRRVEVAIGYGADARGRGIAYARVVSAEQNALVRVPFHADHRSETGGRENGYAAVTAVAAALRKWGVTHAGIAVDDAQLADDIGTHGPLPDALSLPYVRLRCALNAFDDFTIRFASDPDLTARARAEVALFVAA